MTLCRLAVVCAVATLLLILGCADSPTTSAPDDGWQVSRPAEQGLDSALLATLTGRINNGDYGEIHSLLIVRHDYLVYEKYFDGYSSEALHPMYSVTKSVTSALIGIALDQGKLDGVDELLLPLFPEYFEVQNLDSNKEAVTLEDVLTMRAGFQWSESYSVSQMARSTDWIKYMLDLPVLGVPGTTFQYNSGCTILLSGIIRNASHLQAAEFADRHLFGPLGITRKTWEAGPLNLTNTAGGLSLRPRDMAKIGLLYLHEGRWQGREIISRDWIEESTSWLLKPYRNTGYGYQWWSTPLESGSVSPEDDDLIKYASGAGDQFIIFIPALDLVVTATAGNGDGPYDQPLVFLRQYIIPAVKGE
jgi:CubicO group peptidase (beta-lactamase class C family)